MVKIAFSTENDAFDGDDARRLESARILREIADKFEFGSTDTGGVYDANGNRIGSWTISEKDD